MAHGTRISALTDELIQSLVDLDPVANRQAYRHAKELASRALRGHQYARTNQFDVANNFAGLDEKFRVKNRDDLADALQSRLQRFQSIDSTFKPELLSLLLLLSNRPLENTNIEALELLRPPTPPPPLTWAEILKDDPYSDEELWKDVNFASDSSENEEIVKKRRPGRIPVNATEGDETYDLDACIGSTDSSSVEQLSSVQFWNTTVVITDSKILITELQAIRETLFMLSGLETTLYDLDKQKSDISLNPRFMLSHVRGESTEHLLSQFTSMGGQLYRLRQWTKKSSSVPLVQTFEAAVKSRLEAYDRSLSKLQARYLMPTSPTTVSLLELHNNVRVISDPLLQLSSIVETVETELLLNPFSYMEALFEQTVLAQLILDTEIFHFWSSLFFDCLQTYLKPIRTWMEDGELGLNDETFFVSEKDANSNVASLWHDRYALRKNSQNNLQAPSFIHPAARKIFNTGKSIVFLRELGLQRTIARTSEHEPRLIHEVVCGPDDQVPIAPFPELFESAFNNWMQSKYSHASAILRQHIFDTNGLVRVLLLFQTLYLGRNGAIFETFANMLFDRMDAQRRGWNDRYVLTELMHDIYGVALPQSDMEKVVVRSVAIKNQERPLKALASVKIDFALPWPLRNIIQRSSMTAYQQMFTFLLQVYRVKYLLQRSRYGRSSTKRHSQVLRLLHRFTWFINMLRSYLTETVVFFTTQEMEIAMGQAQDIDEMARIHSEYVSRLKKRAMLSEELRPIIQAIEDILDLGVRLATILHEEQQSASGKHGEVSEKKTRRETKAHSEATHEDSDSEFNDDEGNERLESVARSKAQSHPLTTTIIDREFKRLLHFVSAGLYSVGRAGAEPMWEQLAERLDWEGKKTAL